MFILLSYLQPATEYSKWALKHCSRGKCLQPRTHIATPFTKMERERAAPILVRVFSLSRAPPRQALARLPATVPCFIIATMGEGEADGALEQLVHPGGRWDKQPRPRTPAVVGGDGGDDRAGGGGRLEERVRELRRRGGVVVLHAVGVGHALDAVELHGPHQIEPNLPPGPGNGSLLRTGAGPRRHRSSSKVGRGTAPDVEGNREGEGNGMERDGGCGGGWCWVSSRWREQVTRERQRQGDTVAGGGVGPW
jgi:hypothetical protein